jgi:hypothetical protein
MMDRSTLMLEAGHMRARWPTLIAASVFVLHQISQPPGLAEARLTLVTTLQGDLHAWSPDGNRLAYAQDNAIAITSLPDFARECRIRVKDVLPTI